MARSIEGLLVTETDESFQIRHPKDPDALVAKEAELGSLCEIFTGTAIHGTVMAVQDRYTHPRSSQEKKLTELLNKGFLTFVAGHDWRHLIRRHHNIEERGRFWIPKHAGYALGKYEELYKNIYPGVTVEVAAKKMMKQGLELEADYFGYQYTFNTFALHPSLQMLVQNRDGIVAAPPNFNTFFVEIGVWLFLWSMEYFERTVRTLQTGHDGTALGIFSKDFDVQDLVCRDTHPCPRTRLDMASRSFLLAPAANELLGTLFKQFWQRAYPRVQALHRAGERPHSKWLDEGTEVGMQLSFL